MPDGLPPEEAVRRDRQSRCKGKPARLSYGYRSDGGVGGRTPSSGLSSSFRGLRRNVTGLFSLCKTDVNVWKSTLSPKSERHVEYLWKSASLRRTDCGLPVIARLTREAFPQPLQKRRLNSFEV